MLLKHRSSWSLILFISGLLLCFPTFLTAESPETAMSERLVDLGLHIERQIELAQFNLERGTLDQTILKRQAEEAATALEGLEGQIHTLPEVTRDPLLLKLVSIKAQAENLALAAKLNSAPPRRTPADTAVRHLDRGGHARSNPANDDCDAAFVVGFGSYAGDTTEATNDGEALCGASLYSPDVWYRFVASANTWVVIDTVGSSFDTVLSIHEGCPGTINNQITCNDDSSGLQSAVGFIAYAPNEYLIRVSGANGSTGSYTVTLSQGGGIEGTVTERGTGLPVSTRVTVFNETGYFVDDDYTDTSGIYSVNTLPPGNHFVTTNDYSELINELFDDHSCPGGGPNGCDVTTGDEVSVVVGEVTNGIDFSLDHGAVITGVVQAEQTGTPVYYAKVKLYNEDGSYQAYRFTDSSGVYWFRELSEGAYYLVATSSSYFDELYNDIPCQDGPPSGCVVTEGTAVPAELNSTTTGIDFALKKQGTITGTVIDQATGLPIAAATTRIYNHSGTYLRYDTTDPTGVYEFGGLADGTYYLVSGKARYASQLFDGQECPLSGCQVLTGTPVVISNQAIVAGIDFDLTKKGFITGQVVDSTTTTPIPGVRVQAYNQSGSAIAYNFTDSSGFFEIEELDQTTYFVATTDNEYFNEIYDNIPCPEGCYPTTGTPVEVFNGQTTAGINFSIIPKGRLTGSVTAEDGSGAVMMAILCYDSFGTYVGQSVSSGGSYEISGLDNGQYFVVAERYSSSYPYLGELYDDIECWGGPTDGCVVTTGTPVTIAAATVTSGIDFVLTRAGTISGTVLDAVDNSQVSGLVYVREAAGSGVWEDSLYLGAYAFGGLIPGDYLVIADASTHVDEMWQDIPCAGEYPHDCDISNAIPVTLSAASEITIDFSLQRLATIGGTVQSAVDGSPLNGYSVRAYDAGGDSVASGSTDSSGEYKLTRLWPATVFVATDEHNLNFFDQLFDGIDCPQGPPDGCDPTTGTPLVVEVNTSLEGIDFSLDRTGSISGKVTDKSTGLPLYGINVEVWDAEGTYLKYDSTNSLGYYLIRGLENRIFFVATDEFDTSDTYLDMLYDGAPCPTGPPAGCDPTKGTPVSVALGATSRFIDLALPSLSTAIAGMVTDLGTGEPIPGVFIDLWKADTGTYEVGLLTSPAGTYIANVDPGTYVAATDNTGDWVNQIFDGIECFEGSPYNGDCDPMVGTVITVEEIGLTSDINFLLRPQNGSMFTNGFESGDTTGWDMTVP